MDTERRLIMAKVKKIDITLKELFEYNPTVFQTEVHRQRQLVQYLTLVAHRRFGKTECGLLELLSGALTCQRRLPIYDYIAPTLKQAKKIAWDKLKFYCETAQKNGMKNIKISETNTNVKIYRGGKIGVATIGLGGWEEPESLRGPYNDGIIVDEAADMKPGLWGKVIAPKLADRRGWAMITGTVKGLDQFYDFYQKGIQGVNQEEFWGSLYFPIEKTRGGIPWLDDLALRVLRSGVTATEWDQEMNCNWVASDDNILIPLKHIDLAKARSLREQDYYRSEHVLGVDVASRGSDPYVIARRWGPWFVEHEALKDPDPELLAMKIKRKVQLHNIDAVFVDGTGGYAGALMLALRNIGVSCPIYEIGFKCKAVDELHYENIRAEMWDKMGKCIEKYAVIPDDIELHRELSCVTYDYKNKRMIIEPKEEIRKKLGRSPDRADAYALTFAYEVTPLHLQNTISCGNINKEVVRDEFEL